MFSYRNQLPTPTITSSPFVLRPIFPSPLSSNQQLSIEISQLISVNVCRKVNDPLRPDIILFPPMRSGNFDAGASNEFRLYGHIPQNRFLTVGSSYCQIKAKPLFLPDIATIPIHALENELNNDCGIIDGVNVVLDPIPNDNGNNGAALSMFGSSLKEPAGTPGAPESPIDRQNTLLELIFDLVFLSPKIWSKMDTDINTLKYHYNRFNESAALQSVFNDLIIKFLHFTNNYKFDTREDEDKWNLDKTDEFVEIVVSKINDEIPYRNDNNHNSLLLLVANNNLLTYKRIRFFFLHIVNNNKSISDDDLLATILYIKEFATDDPTYTMENLIHDPNHD